MINTALNYAAEMHAGQVDKAGAPYILHCEEVAKGAALIAVQLGMSEAEIGRSVIVGLLHDVVEDTGATIDNIEQAFGPQVASVVDILTKRPNVKRNDYLRLCRSHPVAKVVKMADALHNSDATRFSDPTEAQLKKSDKYYDDYEFLAGLF